MSVAVLIPALNEEQALPLVLAAIPRGAVERVIVVDNGSTDATVAVARAGGAEVVCEPRRGYGSACLAGLAHLRDSGPPEVVVFLDGDHADDPAELPSLVGPIVQGRADFVLGSRVLGERQRGALTPQARVGNVIACGLLRGLYGARHTDLGPFRAIRWEALEGLAMRDTNYGWTVEMQLKAARAGLRVTEVPVSYRVRVGQSKISGTVRGAVGAGVKILYTVFRYWAAPPPSQPQE